MTLCKQFPILFVTRNPHEIKQHSNIFNAQQSFYMLGVAHNPVVSLECHKVILIHLKAVQKT